MSAPGKDFRTRKKDLQILKIALCLHLNFGDSTILLNSAQCLNQSVSILKALSGIASAGKYKQVSVISITKNQRIRPIPPGKQAISPRICALVENG